MTLGSGDGRNEIFFWSLIHICRTRTKNNFGWLGVVGQMFYTSPKIWQISKQIASTTDGSNLYSRKKLSKGLSLILQTLPLKIHVLLGALVARSDQRLYSLVERRE